MYKNSLLKPMEENMNVSRLMTKEELADLLRTSKQTITNQINQGKEGNSVPPAIQLGKNYRWCQETVYQWLKDKEHERKVLLALPSESTTPISKVQINRI
jgi:predicted DNA-binding transcriptional regulator AlpA